MPKMFEVIIILVAIFLFAIVFFVMERLDTYIESQIGNSFSSLKKENLANRLLKRILNNSDYLSYFITFWIAVIVVLFGVFTKQTVFDDHFNESFIVELFGILFEVIILFLFFSIVTSRREKKIRIKNLLNIIEKFRLINSQLAKAEIRSTIIELNELGFYKIDLKNVDLGGESLGEIVFNGSYMFETYFNNTVMAKSKLNKVVGSNVKFDEAIMFNSTFQHAHFQRTSFKGSKLLGADFSKAILSSVDFSGADLRAVNFEGATISNVDLHFSEVKEDFIETIKKINLYDAFDLNSYTLKSKPWAQNPNHKVYRLIRN
jgi:uncharacterized protein YjbI with pentapeptide repeats